MKTFLLSPPKEGCAKALLGIHPFGTFIFNIAALYIVHGLYFTRMVSAALWYLQGTLFLFPCFKPYNQVKNMDYTVDALMPDGIAFPCHFRWSMFKQPLLRL